MRENLRVVVVQKLAVSIYKLNEFSRGSLFNSGLLVLHKISQGIYQRLLNPRDQFLYIDT
jgi:hypothetical protein